MVDLLNTALVSGEIGAWWPSQGTLIGLLRYGEVKGHLSGGKVDCVDHDLDFDVMIPNATLWFRFGLALSRRLLALGREWGGCEHLLRNDFDDISKSWRTGPVQLDPRGMSIFQCTKFTRSSDVIVNVFWLMPVTVLPRDTLEGPVGTVSSQIHFGADKVIPGSSLALASSWARSSSGMALVPEMGIFATWRGLLPWSMIFPVANCRAYTRLVPCPRKSLEFLKGFNSGEYWQPGGHCLGVPDIVARRNHSGRRLWDHIVAIGNRDAGDERNLALEQQGLDPLDMKILRSRVRSLRQEHVLSHNLSECKPEHYGLAADWTRLRS